VKVRDEGQRVVAWFSCGGPSAVTAKLAIAKYGAERVTVAYCDTGSEHSDNERFLADCERWLGKTVTRLKSDTYSTTWDVFEKRRFLRGPRGAPCTTELKKIVRQRFERSDDIQCFGYTADRMDAQRAERFRLNNFELMIETPLIDGNLSRSDCLAMLDRAGIAIPAMYLLGFNNNNCIGCVKAETAGYWNRVRRHFPATFDRMAKLERELGYALVRIAKQPVWLDELDPTLGANDEEPQFDCSLFCHIAEDEIAA
jgi:hypothetical protein